MAHHSVHELRLMLVLALRGGTAATDQLRRVVGHRRRFEEAAGLLAAQGVIIMDRSAGQIRLLHGRALELLGLPRMPGIQGEIFSEGCLLPAATPPAGKRAPRAHAQAPGARVEAPGAQNRAPRQHAQDMSCKDMSCKFSTSRSIHEHEHGAPGARAHEVGELSPRSTAEIMGDVRRLLPGLSAEHLAHWQERIEREDAELVSATFRQLELQWRQVLNPAGWANANYLKAVMNKRPGPAA